MFLVTDNLEEKKVLSDDEAKALAKVQVLSGRQAKASTFGRREESVRIDTSAQVKRAASEAQPRVPRHAIPKQGTETQVDGKSHLQ